MLTYWKTLARAVLGRLALKASAVGPAIARLMVGRPVWPKRYHEQLAREGYQQNAVVHAGSFVVADPASLIADASY